VIKFCGYTSFGGYANFCGKEVRSMRVIITLACTECSERNYTTTKNKRKHPDRLELRKYCPRCNAHRVHRETK
jgi:large subunit ribosomal protein L33